MLKPLLSLAIYFLSTTVQAEWKVTAVQGSVTVQKAPLSNQKVLSGEWHLSASPSSSFTFKQNEEQWSVRFLQKTSLKISHFSEGISVQLLSGEIQVRSNEQTKNPFVVELEGWQLQKNKGQLKVRKSNAESVVNNISESLWVKQAELSGAPQEIVAGLQFKIQNNQQIFGFENTVRPGVPARWSWAEKSRKPASAKKDANSLCNSPSGNFEQCAWKCLGQRNSRSKICDTGYAHVHCLRLMCTAGGDWKWPTIVPGDACPARGVRIDSCK